MIFSISAKSSSLIRELILLVVFPVWPQSVSTNPLTRVLFFHPTLNRIAFAFLPSEITSVAATGRVSGFDIRFFLKYSDGFQSKLELITCFINFPVVDIEGTIRIYTAMCDLNIARKLELSISFSLTPLSLGARVEFGMNRDRRVFFARFLRFGSVHTHSLD